MKKRFITLISFLLVLVMTAAAFSACGGGSGTVTDATGAESDEITTNPANNETDEQVSDSETSSEESRETESESASEVSSEISSESASEGDSENESKTEQASETEQPSETETEIVLDVEYGKTIALADKLSGGVNVEYSSDRKQITISNKNFVLEYALDPSGGDGAVRSPYGKEYIAAVSKPFVKSTNGKVFFSYETATKEKFNAYRLGSYYYEVHMMNGSFSNYTIVKEAALNLKEYRSGHSISKVVYKNGELSYTITSESDPYLSGSSFRYDTAVFNGFEITMSTTASSSATIYLAAGSHGGIDGSQHIGFTVIPDGEFHTYYVPLSAVPDYTGDITNIRLDVGSKVGEEIRVSSMNLVSLAVEAPAVKLDKTYHLYSDKVNEIVRLVASEDVNNLASFGSVTEIAANTVDKLIIKDKKGTHTSLDGVDMASVEYVAFDVKGVGVCGFILLPDESSGVMSVELKDGNYVLTQEYTLPKGYVVKELEDVRSGRRIYTDGTHRFDGFLKAAEEERNPLTGFSVYNTDGASYVGYDPFRGAYFFDVKGNVGFQTAYDNPYHKYVVSANFGKIAKDRAIYVVSKYTGGNLESGAVLSDDGLMLPIDLEVCKNFKGENEEPFFDYGDTAYGEIIFPMYLEAGKNNDIHILNLFQNWGMFTLKQISSVQFGTPYYHLSLGVTETNCIAPYFVNGNDNWMLPDFRAMSAPFWDTQPQHTSIGRLYFLQYTTADGQQMATESINNKITSYGPTYCDIDMNYLSDDGKINVYYRHMEMPHTDENRTYYEIVLEVQDDIEINDFKNDFSFFSFDGRHNFYTKLGYLNEKNECVIANANTTSTPNYITLGDKSPYISYFDGPETDDLIDYVNFGLVVKNSSFNIGGKEYDGNFILRDVKEGNLNYMCLTLDLGKITLKKGDTFKINMILMPWGDPSVENDDNVRNVRQDSCLDPYKIEASVGTVIEDEYLPCVMSDNGNAEFTLSGGTNNCVVRVYGFDKLTVPTVMEKIDGKWKSYKLCSNVYEYDGYTVYYDGDGTYSYAFVVDMSEGKARTFKVTANKEFGGYEDGWLEGDFDKFDVNSLPLNVYVTPENYKQVGASMSVYGSQMTVADDLSCFRFTSTAIAVESYVTPVNNTMNYTSTGQYIVFRYRVPTTNSASFKGFEIFTSTQNGGATGGDSINASGVVQQDGQWHVYVLDASAIKTFTPKADGTYLAKYFRIDIMSTDGKVPADCYMDIAYFGISDSIEDICKLNSDLETITLYQNGSAKTVVVATGEIQ